MRTSSPSPETRLEVVGVSKHFGGVLAVADVSLALSSGVVGLLGPNGSGKSTLINVVGGQLRPSRGSVIFDGRDITRDNPVIRSRHGLARTFQAGGALTELSALDNVLVGMGGAYRGRRWMRLFGRFNSAERDFAVSLLEDLGFPRSKAKVQVAGLPLGERRIVALARALAMQPQALLMDEALVGLELHRQTEILERVKSTLDPSAVLVVVEHNLDFLAEMAADCVFLFNGSVIARGLMHDLMEREDLRTIYFGTV